MISFNLRKAGIATVDEVDSDLLGNRLYPVHGKTATYVQQRKSTGVHGKVQHLLLHRIIMERVVGRKLESDEIVDHIDRNGLNNSRSNLRICTQQNNTWNRKGRKGTVAGLKGVAFMNDGRKKCWVALIRVNGKNKRLGAFYTAEEAHAAYVEAAKKYFGEFARAA